MSGSSQLASRPRLHKFQGLTAFDLHAALGAKARGFESPDRAGIVRLDVRHNPLDLRALEQLPHRPLNEPTRQAQPAPIRRQTYMHLSRARVVPLEPHLPQWLALLGPPYEEGATLVGHLPLKPGRVRFPRNGGGI